MEKSVKFEERFAPLSSLASQTSGSSGCQFRNSSALTTLGLGISEAASLRLARLEVRLLLFEAATASIADSNSAIQEDAV